MLGFPCEILFCFVVCNFMSDPQPTSACMFLGQRWAVGGFLNRSSPYFFETRFDPNPELTVSSRLVALGFLESVCPVSYKLLHHAEAGGACSDSQCLTRELGTEPHAHRPVQQQGTPLSPLSRAGFFLTLYCLN